jgi:EAL domain-containing protein (putative c-di-GMP-specific phosphodiesterase class I)
MDDFGVGYSSLNYLRLFPFDKIKIDRSFVNDLSNGDDLLFAIVQSVAQLARVLKVPTTAEGIETKEQLELVRAAGCTEFQGYLFSAPRPVGGDCTTVAASHPVGGERSLKGDRAANVCRQTLRASAGTRAARRHSCVVA